MNELAATVFVASLLGSLHCAGMCGGLVAFYAGAEVREASARGLGHLAYNLGRLVTYVTLGALAGVLGSSLDFAGSLAGLQRVAPVVAGGLIVGWGGFLLMQTLGWTRWSLTPPAFVTRRIGPLMSAARGLPLTLRAAAIGLLTGLLPCGWLYAFVVTAAGTGTAQGGALTMAFFWAGTLPVMVGLGVAAQSLSGPLRRRLPALTAVALVVVGLFAVLHRSPVAPTDPHACCSSNAIGR